MKRGTAIAVLVLVVIGLAAADQFLARVESAEVRNTAEHSYAAGTRLLASGKTDKAIDSLREAHSLDRQNDRYAVQLIAALTKAGRATDAEPLLTDVLQREPNDGAVNLAAAHLKVREGEMAEAEAYFHRAIYGRWREGADARRVAVRLELIDLLAERQRKQELLAELLALEAEGPADPKIQRRIGALFLKADSPARGADVYQSILNKDQGDVAALEGLGQAELEEGRYRAAHEAFERASQRDPSNESVRNHLDTLSAVTGLDPTLRQLTSAEKYRRSIRILEMTRQEWGACGERATGNSAPLAAADAVIGRPAPAHATNEAAEGVLSLAEMLWRAEPAACNVRSEALRLIMRKLAG
jgi:tetratricopeptide (TPR) repeat protein